MNNSPDIHHIVSSPSAQLRLLTAAEAASYLRISRNTLWRMERQNLIVPYRTPGGHRRYTVEILNDYLERTRQASVQQIP